MLYNKVEKSHYIQTAGKITIAAAVFGLLTFAFVFLFNAGKTELLKVEAQTASTTLTVLNTPPQWITLAYEEYESSTSSPTNSGTEISWVATASNNGGVPYYLIVCSTVATPTIPVSGSPYCNGGVQWGVSASTTESTQARVATTTTEVAPFLGEVLPWFAWVCDNDAVNPRCNNTYSQGLSATNSSPFHVNSRPEFTDIYGNPGSADPGGVITFYSSSTDPDVVGGEDTIVLHVCSENDFSTTTVSCGPGGTLATTTVPVTFDATASFTLPAIIQDDVYDAYTFIVDEHGHTAQGGQQGTNEGFTVNNVAPTVNSGSISLNGGANITISVLGGETPNYPLTFETSDANSCLSASSTATTSEMTGYSVALFRGSIGTSTCNGLSASYNPNNCYPSGVATTTWNLSCTASSTSCTGANDPTMTWSCTFPLWFVAEPTDSSSPYSGDNWVAAIAGVDDNNATGTVTIGASPVPLISIPGIDLLTAEIPYGSLEPGQKTNNLTATSTILSVGNTGLNQNIEGEAMCPGFAVGNECLTSASSTIPDFKQEFATSSVSYNSGFDLSSSTPQLLLLKVPKTSSTTAPNAGVTYWGIEVPIDITVAGAYTGLNTFYAVTSSSSDWGI